jgi:hypothetical protein
MSFIFSYDAQNVSLTLSKEKGVLTKILKMKSQQDLDRLACDDSSLLLALADLKSHADGSEDELKISPISILKSHRLAASLNSKNAEVFGLPPMVDLVLKTDVEGVVGSSNFKLRYEWSKNGLREQPKRSGSILKTSNGLRRLPLWMMEALDVADRFKSNQGDFDHWAALARFRQALEPGVTMLTANETARVSMTDFLSGLQVQVADRFSISPKLGGQDFEIVPFSSYNLDEAGYNSENGDVPEEAGELIGAHLKLFQEKVRERGALPAYRLSPGSFLVIDAAASPALRVMADAQKLPPHEREAFVKNPRPSIADAVEKHLRSLGTLTGLSEQAEEEVVESSAVPLFIETREFSERVTGLKIFEKIMLDFDRGSGTTWLPEYFAKGLAKAIQALPQTDLIALRQRVEEAENSGEQTIYFAGITLPAVPETIVTIDSQLKRLEIDNRPNSPLDPVEQDSSITSNKGPIILDTLTNFEDVNWATKIKPRQALISEEIPVSIRTPLKQHQIESLQWQIKAWKSGLPGILNADEQGLGKTLQTIAFITWLKNNLALPDAKNRGPALVVAPTSLLENWEQEVSNHVIEPGFGHLIRLYGSATNSRKFTGARGTDIQSGEDKLDFNSLHEAIKEGRAHRMWLLTTYTTLANYHHSIGRIPFSVAVFDEIQNLKNPSSLRSSASMSINADFRIGLTGTPIENSCIDLWAIMEQLAPGSLGSLKEFREKYSNPNEQNMLDLYKKAFVSQSGNPPVALRRLKDQVTKDLPQKSRRLHPSVMPNVQAVAYEEARSKLVKGGSGASLKVLHHIRTVSVHPSLNILGTNADFIGASARLQVTLEILKDIKSKNERALVFIESIQMQYRFIELVKAELNLEHVDLINGDTPIAKRQNTVNRFQKHLENDRGFDLLVLGPKAAGTGLTLTAATHVIHLSRWWNPAVEEQCNDRTHRMGQTKPVTIHMPLAIHPGYRESSFDCLLHSLMHKKRQLASSALWPMGDDQTDVKHLQKMLANEQSIINGDPIKSAISAMFQRDKLDPPLFAADGSVSYP